MFTAVVSADEILRGSRTVSFNPAHIPTLIFEIRIRGVVSGLLFSDGGIVMFQFRREIYCGGFG